MIQDKSTVKEHRYAKVSPILILLIIFTLVGLVFSLIMEYQNIKQSKVIDNICTATGSDCNAVQNSDYGKILGIKVVHLGVAAFFLYTLILLWHLFYQGRISAMLILFGGILAGFGGMYFIYAQIFILKQYCIYCLIVDSSSILIMILSFFLFLKNRSLVRLQKAL
jgi:uncharacterized membrane protein